MAYNVIKTCVYNIRYERFIQINIEKGQLI